MKRSYQIVVGMALALCVYVWYTVLSQPTISQGLHIYMPYIGQGDATLIVAPGGGTILVDGGPDGAVTLEKIKTKLSHFNPYIDIIVATHGDADHVSGLKEILDYAKVGVLVVPRQSERKEEMAQVISMAESKNIPIVNATDDGDMELEDGVYLDMMEQFPEGTLSENNQSVVFQLVWGQHRFMFTGDAETEREHALSISEKYISAQMYKGGHHGSSSSSSEEFLSIMDPTDVVFQNGINNRYGHPDPNVVDRLEKKGYNVYNTSVMGDVTMDCLSPEEDCIITTEFHEASTSGG